MQEGADRGRRRHEEGRGAAAHQERRQGGQGRGPRRRRRRRSARTSRPTRKTGALVEVNCETDFVAKNDDFLGLRAGGRASWSPTKNPADVAALVSAAARRRDGRGRAPGADAKIGENMTIRRFERAAGQGQARALPARRAKIGVLVDFEGDDDRRQGRRDAHRRSPSRMSMSQGPRCRPTSIAARARHRQRRARRSPASPPRSSPRWSRARVKKYLARVTLLGQPFVKDDKQTVEKMLEGEEAPRCTRFTLYVVGEGIEKKPTTSPPKWRRRWLRKAALSTANVRRISRPDMPMTAGLQAHPAQAVGRSPDGRRRLRHQPRDHRCASSREIAEVVAAWAWRSAS